MTKDEIEHRERSSAMAVRMLRMIAERPLLEGERRVMNDETIGIREMTLEEWVDRLRELQPKGHEHLAVQQYDALIQELARLRSPNAPKNETEERCGVLYVAGTGVEVRRCTQHVGHFGRHNARVE